MPFISKIEARAYARVTEILERVQTAIANIFPESIRPRVSLETLPVEGQAGDIIVIVISTLEHRESCEDMFNYILTEIGMHGRQALKRSLDLRIDEDSVFFLRLDKQASFLGQLEISDTADVVSIRVHFRNYPRCTKAEIKQIIENRILSTGGEEYDY